MGRPICKASQQLVAIVKTAIVMLIACAKEYTQCMIQGPMNTDLALNTLSTLKSLTKSVHTSLLAIPINSILLERLSSKAKRLFIWNYNATLPNLVDILTRTWQWLSAPTA